MFWSAPVDFKHIKINNNNTSPALFMIFSAALVNINAALHDDHGLTFSIGISPRLLFNDLARAGRKRSEMGERGKRETETEEMK